MEEKSCVFNEILGMAVLVEVNNIHGVYVHSLSAYQISHKFQ
jgi:hypothetical protein